LPFGEELFAPAGGRTAAMGYSGGDGVRQQFTSKERDVEIGLDFSQARYYAFVQGRFTGPDPTLLSLRGTNPQTLNRYTYVLNNPLLFVDPLGLWELEYSPEYEGDRTDKVKTIKIYFHKTKDTDNADTLLQQLGFNSNDKGYTEMKAQIEKAISAMGDLGIEASTLKGGVDGINIGSTFKEMGNLLGRQANFDVEHRQPLDGRRGPVDIRYFDCSTTTARLSFGNNEPGQIVGIQNGATGIDDRFLSSADEVLRTNLRLLDVVRFDGNNNVNLRHYMSVVFTGDDGTTQAFSRSGENGRFQIIPIDTPSQMGYGNIRGTGQNQSGFYRP
jgi:RHS repeat-associated protein